MKVSFSVQGLLKKILSNNKLGPLAPHRPMSKKRQEAREAFAVKADLLIGEVTTGKWDHIIPQWSSIPVEEWGEVLQEFSSRCPGHSKSDYIDALRRSQWNNR